MHVVRKEKMLKLEGSSIINSFKRTITDYIRSGPNKNCIAKALVHLISPKKGKPKD